MYTSCTVLLWNVYIFRSCSRSFNKSHMEYDGRNKNDSFLSLLQITLRHFFLYLNNFNSLAFLFSVFIFSVTESLILKYVVVHETSIYPV